MLDNLKKPDNLYSGNKHFHFSICYNIELKYVEDTENKFIFILNCARFLKDKIVIVNAVMITDQIL